MVTSTQHQQRSRSSHWRAGYSETGPPGSEGGHAEKDQPKLAPRCVADPTQTLKKWLAKQPLARSRAELQRQLDAFRTYYNQHRPHRALDGTTPAQRFAASPTARPADTPLRLTQTHLSLSTVPAKRAGVIHTRGVSITMGSRWAGHDLTVISYGSKIVILDDTRPLRILTLEPGRTSYPLLLPMS